MVAERKLLYSVKGQEVRHEFAIQVTSPVLVQRDAKRFPIDDGAAVCTVRYEGLDEPSFDVHGIDPIHALAEATNIDRYLRALAGKYDFYWATGEPYFDG